MDVLLPAFQLCYFIVHFLYSLAQAVLDCFLELYHIIANTLWWKKHKVLSTQQVLQDASKLKKLPRHLGLVLISKQTSNLKQICSVIAWAVGFGIPNISLYDIDGILKLRLPSLFDAMSQTCVDFSVKVIVDGQVYTKECVSCPSSSEFILKSKNRFCFQSAEKDVSKLYLGQSFVGPNCGSISNRAMYMSQTILTLNILSIEDGKEDIVRLAKKSCDKNSSPFDAEYINCDLITKGQVDPDLVVIVGRPICSFGFLPWQIRLTEFLNIPSLSRLDYFEFRKLLQIYSKCEQRFGS